MLRMPSFSVEQPDTVAGVIEALKAPGAQLVAGGTDLLPNLKHRLEFPKTLVSLAKVAQLRAVAQRDGALSIGAGVTLTELSNHELVRRLHPSLAQAAGLVASPLLRNMGTLGGNVHLDTRCRYVNQTHFWRTAIGGGCLKSEGDVCHVVPKGRSCVAAFSADTVPVLITLDAVLHLAGPEGEREVAVADYYNTDGVSHINRRPGEVLTHVTIPDPTGPRRTTYVKWTVRRSIDFPLISVALRFDLESDGADGRIQDARACLGVLASRPKEIKRLDAVIGQAFHSSATGDALCSLLEKQGKPLENVPYEAAYRKRMIPVYVRREWQRLVNS